MDDIERILEKAHALRAKKASEGNAGMLKPRLSAGELKDKKISTAPATPGQRSHAQTGTPPTPRGARRCSMHH